jgi:hypothetical protein
VDVRHSCTRTNKHVARVWTLSEILFDDLYCTDKSRDSSVGIALGYRLGDRGSRFRFPAGVGNFSLHHGEQNGSGANIASDPMGTRGSFHGRKAAGE